MAVSAITSIKNIIGYKGSTRKCPEVRTERDESLEPVPTVGFRVGYTRGTSTLHVRVLGARHLPSKVGMTPAIGYTVKVCTYTLDIGEGSASNFCPFTPGKEPRDTLWIAPDLDTI
jgi:hypothetical protein